MKAAVTVDMPPLWATLSLDLHKDATGFSVVLFITNNRDRHLYSSIFSKVLCVCVEPSHSFNKMLNIFLLLKVHEYFYTTAVSVSPQNEGHF